MRMPELTHEIEMPEGVTVQTEGTTLKVKGPKGELERKFRSPKFKFFVEGNLLKITANNATKREKTMGGTLKAHIKNMIKGVTEGHIYKLKICSGHFPMNVSVNGNKFVVKNFLGEKVPRTFTIQEGAKVKIEDTLVTVEGIDKEIAGQVAADIEQLCRITNRDIRIFQDGIYILEKSGKSVQ